MTSRSDKDVEFNGIKIAVYDTTTAGFHDTAAIYDVVNPTKNAMMPVGEWNHILITSDRNRLEIELKGEKVNRIDFDEWPEPNKRPVGSVHKFDVAYETHPCRGYIGLKDHGAHCLFKNIKLLPLT